MTFILESLSIDKKVAYSYKSEPFSISNLNAILQNFSYKRWMSTRYDSIKEYSYVLKYASKSTININAHILKAESSTLLPDLDVMNLRSSENIDFNEKESYMCILSDNKLYSNIDKEKSLVSAVLLLSKGQWYIVIDKTQISKLVDSIRVLNYEYSSQSGRPRKKVEKRAKTLSILAALRLLQKHSREDMNTDSWSNLLELRSQVLIKAIPSKSTAKYIPDFNEFKDNIYSRHVELDISKFSAIPYYYTGILTDYEHMIIFVNDKWFMIEQEEARKLISHSNDDSRAQRLSSSFKNLSQTEIDELETEIIDKVVQLDLDTDYELIAKIELLKLEWMIFKLIELDRDFSRKSDDIIEMEIPDSELLLTTISRNSDNTEHVYILYIKGVFYEVDTLETIDSKYETQLIWSNK